MLVNYSGNLDLFQIASALSSYIQQNIRFMTKSTAEISY